MRPGSLRQDDQTADDEDRQDCRGQRAAQRKAAKTVIAASQGPGKGQFVNLAKAAWCPVSERPSRHGSRPALSPSGRPAASAATFAALSAPSPRERLLFGCAAFSPERVRGTLPAWLLWCWRSASSGAFASGSTGYARWAAFPSVPRGRRVLASWPWLFNAQRPFLLRGERTTSPRNKRGSHSKRSEAHNGYYSAASSGVAQRRLQNKLTRRANHRHISTIARFEPAPGSRPRAFSIRRLSKSGSKSTYLRAAAISGSGAVGGREGSR
jgi:hypothetical protein